MPLPMNGDLNENKGNFDAGLLVAIGCAVIYKIKDRVQENQQKRDNEEWIAKAVQIAPPNKNRDCMSMSLDTMTNTSGMEMKENESSDTPAKYGEGRDPRVI